VGQFSSRRTKAREIIKYPILHGVGVLKNTRKIDNPDKIENEKEN
jgi:hypothetical protein